MRSGYHIFKKFKAFLASSERVVRRSRMTVPGRGGTETDTGRGTVSLVSVSEGVQRTTFPRQVSTCAPGKYNFFFTPSTTDTQNTCADFKGYWHENHNPQHKPG